MRVLVTQIFVMQLFCFSYMHIVRVHTETCFTSCYIHLVAVQFQLDTQTRTRELPLRKAIS